MRCPTLAELPPPPAGKTGWPWAIETPALPASRADGSPWPRISIVTPSYNQGQFIEETIRSVLLQGYPDLEYIVIDGGSTDQSVEIIRKYERWLTYWVSEKDRGQAHAINKGFSSVTGELFNWINSDDLLLPFSLRAVASAAGSGHAVAGNVINFGAGDPTVIRNHALSAPNLVLGNPDTSFHQPGFWMSPNHIRSINGIDEQFNYVFDLDLIIRYLMKYPAVSYIGTNVAKFRLHPLSKTCSVPESFDEERLSVYKNLLSRADCRPLHKYCRHRVQLYEWWRYLARITKSGRPGVARAACILWRILGNPQVRFTRLSLGAIRRCLIS